MGNTIHVIAIWTHILGIALFVGPQFLLAFAWVPASRNISDLPTRVAAMRTMTIRTAWLGGVGLALILVAGLYLIATFRSYYHLPGRDEVSFNDLRYGMIFSIKMAVLVVMLVITALHTFVVGPKLLRRMEARVAGETVPDSELAGIRRQSMILSMSGLTLTLAIMVMGAMMNTYQYSLK
ncbi:MAG: hypothetical protein ABI782_04765 [Anaerolineaceae bacterium]